MTEHLGILVCETLRREATRILAGGDFADVRLIFFPACGESSPDWPRLVRLAEEQGCDRYCLFGAACLCDRSIPSFPPDRWRVHRFQTCSELLLGRALGEEWRRRGYLLLNPGWLWQWDAAGDEGRGRILQRLLSPASRGLLLLDTGLDQAAPDRLALLAGTAGLPAETLPAGLEHFSLILTNAVFEWRLDRHRREAAAELASRDSAARRLALSEQKYRSLFEDSPVSLWEEDFSAVKDYFDQLRRRGIADLGTHFRAHAEDVAECARRVRVVDVNRATLEMFEAAGKEEMLGNLEKVFTAATFELLRQELEALAAGATRVEAEGVNRTLTGKERFVNLRLSVMPGYEESLGKIVVSLIDLTERKKTEEALQQLSRMKSEFISTAAHELRTPLASILGYAELLLDQENTGAGNPDQRREFLGIICEKADDLTRVVDDLLDVARVESGHAIPLTFKPCDLAELIRRVLSPYLASTRGHQFEVALSGGSAEVVADRGKLAQVLENLLSNAVKYSPAGGPIRISGRWREDEYEIAVEDEGIGMTEEQVARVFDRFYRADASDTAAPGLGLGMSIARTIVEAHGGGISVESRPGRGTRVTFTLPRRPPAAEARSS